MHPYTARITTIGGTGGEPFDHGEYLTQQGCNLGCGSKGMHLTTLHVERWQVLSHVSAVYTSWNQPSETCTVPGRGNIRDYCKAVDIEIGPDDRVAMVRVDFGARVYLSGAACLEYLQLDIQAADGTTRLASVGDARRGASDAEAYTPAGVSDWQPSNADTSNAETSDGGADSDKPLAYYAEDLACIWRKTNRGADRDGAKDNDDASAYQADERRWCHQTTVIPKGLTLTGIGGRTGDSWDQVVLYVCPYLPGKGIWRRILHKHYCKPFKKQVQTLLLCLHRLSKPSATDHQDNTRPVQPSMFHLPPGVRESLAAALFHVTFMQGTTAVNGGEESAVSKDDYIATWVKEEVAQSMKRVQNSNPYHSGGLQDVDLWESGSW